MRKTQELFNEIANLLVQGFGHEEIYGVYTPFRILAKPQSIYAILNLAKLSPDARRLAALMCYIAADCRSKAELRCRLRHIGKKRRLQVRHISASVTYLR